MSTTEEKGGDPTNMSSPTVLPRTFELRDCDLSLESCLKEYPMNCIPDKLSKPTGIKAKELRFEEINVHLYEPEARMVAFRVQHHKILPWIKALSLHYYEGYGKNKDYIVTWHDEPKDWTKTVTGKKTIIIDLATKVIPLMYKITFHINTGVFQVQGIRHDRFRSKDFPYLKSLVSKIVDHNNIQPNTNSLPSLSDTTCIQNVETETLVKDLCENQDPIVNENVTKQKESLDQNNNSHDFCCQTMSNNDTCTLIPFNQDDSMIEKFMTQLEMKFSAALDKVFTQQNENVKKINDLIMKHMETSNDRFSQLLDKYDKVTSNLKDSEKQNAELKEQLNGINYKYTLENEFEKSKMEHKYDMLKQQFDIQSEKLSKIQEEANSTKSADIEKLETECETLKGTILKKDEEILSLKLHSCHDDQSENSFKEVQYKKPKYSQRNSLGKKLPHVLIIGTSNINKIDTNILSSRFTAEKKIAYTLDETETVVSELDSEPDAVVLHSITNAIKENSPQECVDRLDNIVQLLKTKSSNSKIIISLPTPRLDSVSLNNKAFQVSAMLKEHFHKDHDVKTCDNSNLAYKGEAQQRYINVDDGVHLTPNGVALFAANIRDSIDIILDLPKRIPSYKRGQSSSFREHGERDTSTYSNYRGRGTYRPYSYRGGYRGRGGRN